MAEPQVPYEWVGMRVEATIVQASIERDGTLGPLTAVWRTGTLEAVNELGIVASLWYEPDVPEEEPPARTFYPWSSVVELRRAEEG